VPEYGPAHYQYALTLNKLGRKQEAQKEFATAYALNKPPTEKSSGTVQLTEPVQ
jgi:predicted RNA polymerase sigma factor